MSEQAFIDSLRFAQEGEHLRGCIALDTLARLADVLFERKGNADFALTGGVDRRSRPFIEIEVRAELALTCQRCLERLDHRLERRSRLLLVPDGERLPEVGDEEPEVEAMPASAVANVPDLVEQEILLGLPLAPVHAEGQCAPDADAHDERPSSPFAVLAGLKTSS